MELEDQAFQRGQGEDDVRLPLRCVPVRDNAVPIDESPAKFQRLMYHILQGFPFVLVYLDDFVIFSNTMEEHLDHVQHVIDRIAKHCFKIKMNKSFFAQTENYSSSNTAPTRRTSERIQRR